MKPKILLLHGWDWKKYPKFKPKHQWENRQEFLDLLQKDYDVDYPELPGFGAYDAYTQAWTLDDYALWLKNKLSENTYQMVVGYSFGCAAIIHALFKYKVQTPAVCISPAIIRSYKVTTSETKSKLSKMFQSLHLNWIRNIGVNIYLKYVVKNEFYIHGNSFLRATYRNIVRVDLTDECASVLDSGSDVYFIFGSEDTATPSELFLKRIPAATSRTRLVSGATHNVGGSHPQNVVDIINSLNLK